MEQLNERYPSGTIRNVKGGCLVYDQMEKASLMVRIPRFKLNEVIEGAEDVTHPAFIINGKEVDCIYVSKYQNIVEGESAYSLPGMDPAVLLDFQQAEKFCENKGPKWHLMTNAEWSAVCLWSKMNGTLPRGNNDSGSAYDAPEEKGILASLDAPTPEGEQGPPMRVATGSGPAAWSHDWTEEGIYDLNGNVWELASGVRLLDGKIQLMQNNDAALGSTLQRQDDWWNLNANGELFKTEGMKVWDTHLHP
jgi:formylglycine-generating enzyme